MVYSFDINNRAFLAIAEGRKKYEIRVTKVDGSFDYSVIKTGDYIKFISYDKQKMLCKVLKIKWYHTVEELLMDLGVKYTLSSTDDFDEGVKSLNSFDGYTEGMKVNGVFAINIMPTSENLLQVSLNDFKCLNNDINLDEYIKCRDRLKEDMDYPDWLGDFSKETLEELLMTGSKIWMYYHGNNFVSSMMLISVTEQTIKSFGVDFDYREVVDYGPMMVDFKYQGNGLQYQMLITLDDYCRKAGYRYAISTVHPDNIFLISNLEKDCFYLVGHKTFERGKRNIYLKILDS